MGNAYYEVTRADGIKIKAGYGVAATCEQEGCDEKIDRGLGCLCGATPGGDEHGCGGYYCGHHLYMSLDEQVGDLCGECVAAYRRKHPIDAT
ncbi:hypothetical protein ACFXB3_07325 [Streptomyces sp. NPDC059447]|uniref:hypothetical protein n=1 Tax=Streptomyces sp. NPDC059447 TaxID=3346834 RepID=UPI0036A8817C